MSEQEKSLAQIDYEAFDSVYSKLCDLAATPWKDTTPAVRKASESAAQAVAARVREECARIAEIPHADDDAMDTQVRRQVAAEIRAMNEASQ